jgi:hypothetical protein
LFVTAVDRWGRKADTAFSDVAKSGQPIIPQVESWAASQGLTLYDGWKVDVARELKKRVLTGNAKIEEATLSLWQKLFTELMRDQ